MRSSSDRPALDMACFRSPGTRPRPRHHRAPAAAICERWPSPPQPWPTKGRGIVEALVHVSKPAPCREKLVRVLVYLQARATRKLWMHGAIRPSIAIGQYPTELWSCPNPLNKKISHPV